MNGVAETTQADEQPSEYNKEKGESMSGNARDTESPRVPSWTRLAVTASAGDSHIAVQADVSLWPVGGEVSLLVHLTPIIVQFLTLCKRRVCASMCPSIPPQPPSSHPRLFQIAS